jgi:cell division transport system permease protein
MSATPTNKREKERTRSEQRPATAVQPPAALAAVFEQHQSAAVDSLHRLWIDRLSTLLTCTVMGIALALPLALLLLLQDLALLGANVQQVGSISLFMQERDPATLHGLVAQLKAREDVEDAVLITPEQALEQFRQQSGFEDVLAGLDENPLPPVIAIESASDEPASITSLFNYLQSVPGVDEAQLDLQWLQRLQSAVSLATRLAFWLSVLLGLGVVLVIGNTIRLAIANRSAEIVVVKLVGGTDAYVARPFLYAGFWYGVGGGLLALLLVLFSLWTLGSPLQDLMRSYDPGFQLGGIGITGGFLVVMLSGLLGWMGAAVSVIRHLRAIEPR